MEKKVSKQVKKTTTTTKKVVSKKKDFSKSIMFVSSEVQPFCSTGGLADVCGSLPKEIKANYKDSDIRVILPLYKNMNLNREELTYIGNTYVNLSWRKEYCGLFSYVKEGVTYYFIDNEKYFKRDGYYGYMDDCERFAFFSLACLYVLPLINFYPDIIHSNDWQTALVPVYLKKYSWGKEYSNIKTALSIHNMQYQGRYGKEVLSDVLGFSDSCYDTLIHNGDVNFLKAGMLCADKVITVSNTYSKEIQTSQGGFGLDNICREISYKLVGITNGIDYDFYNPKKDSVIWKNYDISSIDVKKENKLELQKQFNLKQDEKAPILSIVSRFVKHKGLDLVKASMEEILNSTNSQFVAVGVGDKEYEDYFMYLNKKYPGRVKVNLEFNIALARKIYAGSDIFLMPSISEPCGLSQMIASRYGCVPIVREVGGLKDTIKDFGCIDGGNGYTFASVNASDFKYSVNRAIKDYENKDDWSNKMKVAMSVDFSWKCSMNKYVDVYKTL